MRISTIAEKGFLARLIEKGIEFFLKKQCTQINGIRIDIFATSIQIIKGEINRIKLKAKEINNKELLFDEIKLEADNVKVKYKIDNKTIVFKNEFIVDFKLKLSETSVRQILLNKNWSWIGNLISKAILNLDSLNNITIENNEIISQTCIFKKRERNRHLKVINKIEIYTLYMIIQRLQS